MAEINWINVFEIALGIWVAVFGGILVIAVVNVGWLMFKDTFSTRGGIFSTWEGKVALTAAILTALFILYSELS